MQKLILLLFLMSLPLQAIADPSNTPKATVRGYDFNPTNIGVGSIVIAQNISCCSLQAGSSVLAVLLLPVYFMPSNNSSINHSNSGNTNPAGWTASGDNLQGTWSPLTTTNQAGIGLFQRIK